MDLCILQSCIEQGPLKYVQIQYNLCSRNIYVFIRTSLEVYLVHKIWMNERGIFMLKMISFVDQTYLRQYD